MEGPPRGLSNPNGSRYSARMQWIDLTLPSPAENLALDEAWLEQADQGGLTCDLLRFWEPTEPAVVVGRASRVDTEVDLAACRERGIPVLRRSSGGAAVVALPGCLMYAVVLGHPADYGWQQLDQIHAGVLERVAAGVTRAGATVERRGTSDLVSPDGVGPDRSSGDRKVSGNSVRLKRHAVLYHGTLLYAADLELIATCLRHPPRQPDYRQSRSHRQFIVNLPVTRSALVAGLVEAWCAEPFQGDWPRGDVGRLVEDKFNQDQWNLER